MKVRQIFKMTAAATVLTIAATAANAQFKVAQPQPLDSFTNLECAIVDASDRDWNDPVYKIEVNLQLDDSVRIKELYVAHTHVSGKFSVRSEQYTNGRLWQTPGKTDWFWSGNRGHGSMKGEVWRSPDMKWFYTEERFDSRGRVEYRMASACHVYEPGH
jgi:hypothetical protein